MQVPGARAPGATGKFDTFCTKWSAGGVRFAIGTSDCNVHVFRPRADGGAAPAWVATLRGHRHDVTSLSWAAAGDRILSGSVDGTARLWSLKGEMVGRALASSSDGPPPERWSSTQLGRPPEEGVAVPIVGQVAWTCDDKMVVAARTDATIGVWDGRSGRPLHTLAAYGTPGASALAHQDRIYVLDCHPTLPHVAVSASYDGTALLWDLGNGVATDALSNIPLGDGECEFVDGRWSPGGDAIVLTDSSGRLHLHGLALGAASAADVNRDGTRVGGATALAAGGGGAAAAPYDQFFATDHEPLAPFDTAEAEAARPRAPICDQAISVAYPQPVQAAAAAAAAIAAARVPSRGEFEAAAARPRRRPSMRPTRSDSPLRRCLAGGAAAAAAAGRVLAGGVARGGGGGGGGSSRRRPVLRRRRPIVGGVGAALRDHLAATVGAESDSDDDDDGDEYDAARAQLDEEEEDDDDDELLDDDRFDDGFIDDGDSDDDGGGGGGGAAGRRSQRLREREQRRARAEGGGDGRASRRLTRAARGAEGGGRRLGGGSRRSRRGAGDDLPDSDEDEYGEMGETLRRGRAHAAVRGGGGGGGARRSARRRRAPRRRRSGGRAL